MEALLENERWVTRLARALVRDDDDADDVVQQARVAYWQRPPRDASSVRSWLGTVVRNLVRNRVRDAARHEARLTADGGEAPAAPPPDDLLERLQTYRMLGGLVEALDEPFRQTVLLRYYEGLGRGRSRPLAATFEVRGSRVGGLNLVLPPAMPEGPNRR